MLGSDDGIIASVVVSGGDCAEAPPDTAKLITRTEQTIRKLITIPPDAQSKTPRLYKIRPALTIGAGRGLLVSIFASRQVTVRQPSKARPRPVEEAARLAARACAFATPRAIA